MSDLPFAKKSLGQHWLTDASALHSIVTLADVKTGDVVLEIGPGTGTLTDELLAAGAEVVALEFDAERRRELERKYADLPANQIFIQEGDIRTYDLSSMPDEYKVVANIPYYLTANLIRKFTDAEHKPQVLALLVQKEVAERLAAAPGSMSMLAVFAQYYYEVSLGDVVPARLFTPPPKVDSQVVRLIKRQRPLFEGVDSKVFFQLVKAGFSAPRKTLHNSLSGGLRLPKDRVGELLQAAQLSPTARPQELSLDDWHAVCRVYSA